MKTKVLKYIKLNKSSRIGTKTYLENKNSSGFKNCISIKHILEILEKLCITGFKTMKKV